MQDWINTNYDQVHLNPDPPHGIDGQCVNLASSWSMYQGGPELMGATAYEIFQNFRSPFYQVILPGGEVKPGDIMFFSPNIPGLTGSAGHVDIVVDQITGNGFRGLDTNWNDNPKAQYINHTYRGVCGWFRKVEDVSARNMTKEEAQLLYEGFVPGRPADEGWVAAWTGKDLGQAENALLDDPSVQSYRNSLLNPTDPGYVLVDYPVYKKNKEEL